MANQVGRAPHWQRRHGYFPAGGDCTYGRLPTVLTQRRFGRVFSDMRQVAFFRADGTETRCGKQGGRRRYSGILGSVFASLASTPSSGQNINRRNTCAEGAHRQVRNCVSPLRTYP